MKEKEIFYDTDCLSCFISINDVTILKKLFEKVIIPQEAYDEFSRIPRLKSRVDDLINDNFIEVISFEINSPYTSYSPNYAENTFLIKRWVKEKLPQLRLLLKMMEF